jgi:Mrp family chromosome partitioning ATPase
MIMGRMFRIITESGREYATRPVSESGSNSVGTLAVEEVPFIEVGGPEGIVTSLPLRPEPPMPRVAPVPAPVEETAESEHPPAVLSVSFHQFPKSGLRLLPTEVTEDLIAYHQPDHPVAVEYRHVRDEILRQFDSDTPHTLLFTSANPVSGTTTVALNIAATLSLDHQAKVLVIDADFARPSLARRLGVSGDPGLADVLGQTIPLAWALQPTSVENLQVLGAGTSTPTTLTAVANDFPRLMMQVRQWFDWVIVDGGTWVEGPSANALGSACDGAFLVSRQPDIDRPEFTQLRAAVANAGAPLRGYITTRI